MPFVDKVTLLDGVEATDTATAGILRYVKKTLQFIGMTTATAKVHVSNNGTNWLDYVVDINTDTVIAINDLYGHLRVVIDEYAAGTISVILVAHE